MTTWAVELTFSEGNSNKFWRARVESSTLYVNYGRIGSDGQTQVKQLGSEAAAQAELAKLEREKRKKGYEDGGGASESEDGDEAEDEDDEDERPAKSKAKAKAAPDKPEAAAPAAPAAPLAPADFAVTVEGRTIDARLTCDGAVVRTVVVERYATTAEAREAFQRLEAQMLSDGYARAPSRDGL